MASWPCSDILICCIQLRYNFRRDLRRAFWSVNWTTDHLWPFLARASGSGWLFNRAARQKSTFESTERMWCLCVLGQKCINLLLFLLCNTKLWFLTRANLSTMWATWYGFSQYTNTPQMKILFYRIILECILSVCFCWFFFPVTM